MSSVQHLREFICERLTAAAEEIFTEFEKTIVQYEEEMDRQRRLLDITWKPPGNFHTADVSQQHDCKVEEVLADQQLFHEEIISSLDQEEPEPPWMEEDQEEPEPPRMEEDQEEPEPPRMEEDQEEPEPPRMEEDQEEPEPPQIEAEQKKVHISQEGEQLVLKVETDLVVPFQCQPEETFKVFENSSIQHEEETHHLPRVLNIISMPQIRLHRIEVPHQYFCEKEEAFQADQQLCNQKCNSNLDQGRPESAHIKEEEENLFPKQDVEQLLLKDETDSCSIAAAHEKNEQSDPKPNGDHIPTYTSPEDVHSHLEESKFEDSSYISGKHIFNQSSFERLTKVHTDKEQYLPVDKTQLTDHLRTHTGEKLFSCKTCGKCIRSQSQLVRHMRTHTGERPFSCKTCGKCFSRRYHLVRHMKTHTGEKPFSCKTCGKCFSSKSQLVSHMKTHTGEKSFSCKTCGKCFSSKSQLVSHMKTHTVEKPYSCQICGKCFSRNGDLLRHMNIHAGEKPYSCKTCGKCFIHNSDLVRHMGIHSQEAFFL